MKVGDKVWVWSPLAYRNIGKIEQGELVYVSEEPFPDVWVQLCDREKPYVFFKSEVFPTRGALCEHYRKVFE